MQRKVNVTTKTVWRFFLKELKGKVDFYSIQDYLHRQGYAVVFFNTENGDKIIESYGLSEYAKGKRAFTMRKNQSHFVFVDMNLSAENKVRSMLHEAAHIYFCHLDENAGAKDVQLQEMQAEAFAYKVLEVAQAHKGIKTAVQISAPIVITALGCTCLSMRRKELKQ